MDNLFLKKLMEWEISLSAKQLEQLELFTQELNEKNSRINLISQDDIKRIWARHILDSIPFALLLRNLKISSKDLKVLDAGSGAGFPGIILAIILPQTHFILVESVQRKYSFLLWIKEKLRLENAQILNMRLGAGGKDPSGFDICIERAMGKIKDVLPLCMKTVREGGFFAAWQNEDNLEEIKRTKNPDFVYNYSIMDGGKKRAIFVFKK